MRPMKLELARADSRAAHPCPPTRRFGGAAGVVENHCPVGSVARLHRAGGKHQMCWCPTSLRALQRLVTLSHYSLCRGGSSPIASALAVSAPALFVSRSHHACRRDEALRSESTHRPDQITGLALSPPLLSLHLSNALSHHSTRHRHSFEHAPCRRNLRIAREGLKSATIVCLSSQPTPPRPPLCPATLRQPPTPARRLERPPATDILDIPTWPACPPFIHILHP